MISVLCGGLAAQDAPLSITDSTLPSFSVGVEFHLLLRARGGIAPYVWSVSSGDLPAGVTLTPEGLLSGTPTKAGAATIVLKVEDSARPSHTITRDFKATVVASLLLEWAQPPAVRDTRIDGVAQVSNGSKEDFDLTVVIVAVAENGRATAIGYQHFALKAGTENVKIPFGNALPFGGYVVHVDAVAEIAARNSILRQRLQTPQALQIVQGP